MYGVDESKDSEDSDYEESVRECLKPKRASEAESKGKSEETQFRVNSESESDDCHLENDYKLYELLGVSMDAGQDEISKAFRQIAMKCHPDRGGDYEKYFELARAYEILKDPFKRELYDNHGEAAFQEDAMVQRDSSKRSTESNSNRSNSDLVELLNHEVEVTLEELCCQDQLQCSATRLILCSSCEGRGSQDQSILPSCISCAGEGCSFIMIELGPGMQVQKPLRCINCDGLGYFCHYGQKACLNCNGKKRVGEQIQFSIKLSHGIKDGDTMKLCGLGNQSIDGSFGDIQVLTILQYYYLLNQ